jgi:hypothetical protein
LGQCDVVFLLSALGQFCGKADLTLLRDQVRDAGIDAKAVILVGSQLDLALRQSSEIVKTGREMAAKFPPEKRAAGTVAAMLFVLSQKMNEHINTTLQDILRQPTMDDSSRKVLSALQKRKPLYISAWSWMIAENFEQISADDSEQLQSLCQLTSFDFDPDSLRQLSNIPAVREAVLAQRHIKDELTKGKEQWLFDGAAQGVNDRLNKLLAALRQRAEQINNGDIVQLQSLQKDTQKRLLQGRGKLEAVFDTCVYKVQSDFALLKTDVRAKALECKVESKRETRTESYEVSTSKWYNPFSWGSSKSSSRTVVTIYASAQDAIEQLEHFALDTRRELQRTIMSLVNIQQLRLEVSQAAMALFDTGNANFDGDLVMLEIEKSLRRITIPEVDFGAKDYSALISSQFSGDRVSESQIDGLRQAQKSAIQAIMSDLETAVSAKTTEISQQLITTGKTFVDSLVKDIEAGLNKLCQDIENKELVLREIKQAEEVVKSCIS